MNLVERPPELAATEVGVELSGFASLWSSWKFRLIRWRRKWIPTLIWYGDETDVTITFTEDRLDPEGTNPFAQLFGGGLHEIETRLHNMGIGFDRGMGFGGRDWEWDWSLSGPVHVRFRGRARNPERRVRAREAPKPKLVPAPGGTEKGG